MNDEPKIRPKLQTISIEHEWTDDKEKSRWAKIIAIYLEDSLHKVGLFKTKNREIGEVFFLLVCSNSFSTNPDKNWQNEDISTALIQEEYSHVETQQYIGKIIDSIGTVTIEGLDMSLRKFFDMSDWDQHEQVK